MLFSLIPKELSIQLATHVKAKCWTPFITRVFESSSVRIICVQPQSGICCATSHRHTKVIFYTNSWSKNYLLLDHHQIPRYATSRCSNRRWRWKRIFSIHFRHQKGFDNDFRNNSEKLYSVLFQKSYSRFQ